MKKRKPSGNITTYVNTKKLTPSNNNNIMTQTSLKSINRNTGPQLIQLKINPIGVTLTKMQKEQFMLNLGKIKEFKDNFEVSGKT